MTPGSGVTRHRHQARVGGWAVALDHHRAVHLGGGRLEPGDEVDEVLEFFCGRQEYVQEAIADLCHHRGGGHAVGFLHGCDVVVGFGSWRVDQRAPAPQWVGVERRARRMPADRVERQPKPGGRIAVDEHDAAAAQSPVGAGPAGVVVAAVQRQHVRGGFGDGLVEPGQERGPGIGVVGHEVVAAGDRVAGRLAHRGGQPAQRVFVGGAHLAGGQTEAVGDGVEELPVRVWRDRDRARRGRPRVGQQRFVGPQRRSVGTPVQADLPARQRFSRIPLALVALHQPVRRPLRLELGRQQ